MSVIVLGAFDVALHWGHIRFIRRAQQFGPVTVGLSTDTFLEATKRRPILGYDDRRQGLLELGCAVVPRDTRAAAELFTALGPTFFVCGSDWVGRDHLESAGLSTGFLDRHGVTLVYLPRDHAMSTSRVIEAVREATV